MAEDKKRTAKKSTTKNKDNEKKAPEARLNNVVKPENMGLEEWQRTLRRQAAKREMLGVQAVDAKLCPGEYRVTNPKSKE